MSFQLYRPMPVDQMLSHDTLFKLLGIRGGGGSKHTLGNPKQQQGSVLNLNLYISLIW